MNVKPHDLSVLQMVQNMKMYNVINSDAVGFVEMRNTDCCIIVLYFCLEIIHSTDF